MDREEYLHEESTCNGDNAGCTVSPRASGFLATAPWHCSSDLSDVSSRQLLSVEVALDLETRAKGMGSAIWS